MDDYNKVYGMVQKDIEELREKLKHICEGEEENTVQKNMMDKCLRNHENEIKKLSYEKKMMLARPKFHYVIEEIVGVLLLVLFISGYGALAINVVDPFISEISTLLGRMLASLAYFALAFVSFMFSASIFMMANESLNKRWIRKIQKTKEYEILQKKLDNEYLQKRKIGEQIGELEEKIEEDDVLIDSLETKIRELDSFQTYLDELMNPQTKDESKNKPLVRKKKKNNNDDNN